MMIRLLLNGIIAFSLIFLLGGLYLYKSSFTSLDNKLRDFLFLSRGSIDTTSKIVIVDIDERSIVAFGQWPWSRNVIARVLDNLTKANVEMIGLDIVFSESDKTSPAYISKTMGLGLNNPADYDIALMQSFQNTPTVAGYAFSFSKKLKESDSFPNTPAVIIESNLPKAEYLPQAEDVLLNIDLLNESVYSSGFFNNISDESGIVRAIPMMIKYEGFIYPSLVLEMFRIHKQAHQIYLNYDKYGVENILVSDLVIPLNRHGQMNVNFRGPSFHFDYISAKDIFDNSFDKKSVEGKFILVGTSAIGLVDRRPIVYDSEMPGVEIHANALDNLLQEDFIFSSSDQEGMELALIVFMIIFYIFIFSFLEAWYILPTLIFSLIGMYYFYDYMLFTQGQILNIFFPLSALISTLILIVAVDYIYESKKRKMIYSYFAKKVSPDVVKDLLKEERTGLMEAKERNVTVFFSDIRGFTSISENIGSAKRLIDMLNMYMTPMVENIVKNKGTVDKFIGDAIMAYWNAPVEIEDHADLALSSAVEQIQLLEKLNVQIEKKYGFSVEIGIGINTGDATVGEMGSEGRSDYTVIGDSVNLASRLEGLNKVYGSHIIISEFTKLRLKEKYTIRSLDLVQVKGKEEAVEIFEVMVHKIQDKEIQTYEEALGLYRQKRVKEALKIFQDLELNQSHKLYQMYISRCNEAIKQGVENFDPVKRMTSK